MTAPLAALASMAVSAMAGTVANSPPVVEAVARTNIERARDEFRRGRQAEGTALLDDAIARLDRLPDRRTVPARLQAIRAVALSVKGQSLARSGRAEQAGEVFDHAIALFADLPDEALSPRDRSDYGVALASRGADAQARRQIEIARTGNGTTPEAVNHLARIHLDDGDVDAAETLLRESLLAVPGDADALASLGRIQLRRQDPAAGATLAAAAIAYVEHGRARAALHTLAELPEPLAADAAVHAIRADALRLDAQFDRAVEAYENALATEPEDASLLAGRGAALAALGRLEEARADFEHALRYESDSVALLLCVADVALTLGDADGAYRAARRAVESDSGNATAFGLLAEAERRRHQLEPAVEHIRLARALDASDSSALLRLHATLEAAAGATGAATDLLRQLCARPDSMPDDHATLAETLLGSGRAGDAVAVAEAAAGRWPDDAKVQLTHGIALLDAGRPAEAAVRLRRAAELDPSSSLARLQLALALVQIDGREQEALSLAVSVLAAEPELTYGHLVVAQILTTSQRWDEAAVAARHALARDPDSIDGLALLSRALLGGGDDAGAAKIVRRAFAREPGRADLRLLYAQAIAADRPAKALELLADLPSDATDDDVSAEWLLLRARLRIDRGELDEAEPDLDRVVEIRPQWPDGWFDRAELRRRKRRTAAAIADADRAVELAAGQAVPLAIRAAILTELGRLDEAGADLAAAVEADPGNVFALIQLSRASGDERAARAHLDRALAVEPGNRDVLLEMGWLAIRFGRYPEALELFDRLADDRADTDALTGRAEALRLLGRATEAVTEATRAVEAGPGNPEALRCLGFALQAAGDTSSAVDIFTRVRENDPTDTPAGIDLSWALAADERLADALALGDEIAAAAPADLQALSQYAMMLNDAGEYATATRVARHGLALHPEDVNLWNSLGWALEYGDPPDQEEAEHAYRQSWQRQPADNPDPWVLSCIADVLHLRGRTTEAAELYSRALAIAERDREVNLAVVSTIGWCQLRLGDAKAAARSFLDASAGPPGAEVFDLSLAILCDGRHQRARRTYTDGLDRLAARHPLRVRGYLQVARLDLWQAVRDWPELRGAPVVEQIEADLNGALAKLPAPPVLPFASSR